MAGSTGQHSAGTNLFYAAFGTAAPAGNAPAGAGFTLLAEVLSISGLPFNPSVTKLTHLNSDGKAHEKIPGFLDAGQVTFKINLSSDTILAALAPDGTETTPDWGRLAWVVEFPDGGQWYCTGFIQGMPFDVPEDDRITSDITIEVSGRPTFTA